VIDSPAMAQAEHDQPDMDTHKERPVGTVQHRVTSETRNAFLGAALLISGVTRNHHFLNDASKKQEKKAYDIEQCHGIC
jgi:hypothetical protein